MNSIFCEIEEMLVEEYQKEQKESMQTIPQTAKAKKIREILKALRK